MLERKTEKTLVESSMDLECRWTKGNFCSKGHCRSVRDGCYPIRVPVSVDCPGLEGHTGVREVPALERGMLKNWGLRPPACNLLQILPPQKT